MKRKEFLDWQKNLEEGKPQNPIHKKHDVTQESMEEVYQMTSLSSDEDHAKISVKKSR